MKKKNLMITITIPTPNKRYSIYADGVLDTVIRLKGKSLVSLDDRWPITLYYRFGCHRHLYICTEPEKIPVAPVREFRDVPRPLAAVSELEGRAFDRYKRSMYRLKQNTGGKIMKLPVEFFWLLAEKCSQGRNAMKAVDRLAEKYLTGN